MARQILQALRRQLLCRRRWARRMAMRSLIAAIVGSAPPAVVDRMGFLDPEHPTHAGVVAQETAATPAERSATV